MINYFIDILKEASGNASDSFESKNPHIVDENLLKLDHSNGCTIL